MAFHTPQQDKQVLIYLLPGRFRYIVRLDADAAKQLNNCCGYFYRVDTKLDYFRGHTTRIVTNGHILKPRNHGKESFRKALVSSSGHYEPKDRECRLEVG